MKMIPTEGLTYMILPCWCMETALKNSLTQEDITLRGVVIFVVAVGLMSHTFSESVAYNKPEPIFKKMS